MDRYAKYYIYCCAKNIAFHRKKYIIGKEIATFPAGNTAYMCAGILHKRNMERQKKENGCLGKIWKDVQTPT